MTPERRNLQDMLNNGHVEIRATKDGIWWSGIFDNYDCVSRSGRWAEVNGFDIYTSLNPNGLPVTNRIKPYQKAVKDCDVLRINRIPFDLDPERETGTAASDMQIEFALARVSVLQSVLSGFGWKEPMVGMSGNGYHVQYRCDLPNTPEVKKALIDLYRGLGIRVSTAEVAFDVTVKNASRIFRMYGTTNRKADRRSSVLMPDNLSLVPADLFFAAVEALRPPKPKAVPAKQKRIAAKGGVMGLDIVGLFQRMGLYKRPLGDGKHAVICIQCDRHSSEDDLNKTDTVIWEGHRPQYHCSHAHCDGLGVYDVIDRIA